MNVRELRRRFVRVTNVSCLLVLFMSGIVFADSFSSSNFKIDASVGGPLGGAPGSSNYRMVVSGGETIVGNATSSSYKLNQGYVAQLEQALQLTNLNPSVSFGTLTAGSSATVTLNYEVMTDSTNYDLTISQDQDLTNGPHTIPAISSGDITTPAAWNEGTTKGLGVALTSAPSLPLKWGSNPSYNYAAIPSLPTTIYSRTGASGGVTDSIQLQGRVDVNPEQIAGNYTNTLTMTATTIP